MRRREFFTRFGMGAGLAGGGWLALACGGAPAPAAPAAQEKGGREALKITRVRAILTAPGGIRLVAVKVETSEPGLHGLGCATFTQRARAVETAVNHFLAPFLAGKDPDNIEDIWQAAYQSSYWRNGPVLTNALSGVDMALWDIKAKRAGMPLYQLLGGRCRTGVPVYRHASGATPEEVTEAARRYLAEGVRHIRVQVEVPGQTAYGAGGGRREPAADPKAGHFAGDLFEPAAYRRSLPKLFEHLRRELGDEVELLHDVHERLPPIDAIGLAKELERYRLFFLEDPFAPEDIGYFRMLRRQTSTPIAMGELFTHPLEWVDLVSERLIDFIRCHISAIGGLSVAWKLAHFCDFFRVRTAWHGPGDVTPIGHAVNLHLGLAAWNFGIQEFPRIPDATREVFPGTPELRGGMAYPGEKPGIGVDLDETLAAKYPITDDPPFDFRWGRLRDRDGTIRRP